MMVGRTVDELYPRSAHIAGEPILEISDLAGNRVPGSVSLSLRRGEVLGIAGLVGAGRTEFIRALFGLDPVRAGRVRFGSFSGWSPPAARWRQGMGMLSEDRKNEGLATGMSLADNLTLSRLGGLGPLGLISRSRQFAVARDWAGRLGVRHRSPAQRVADLSGGNQQKVALARLLYHGVDVLLLDEPTRGIDVASKAQIYALIDRLVTGGDAGAKAILLVSSYLPELLGTCDRVAVMCRGRLGPARHVKEWTEESLMAEAIGMGGAMKSE